MQVVFDYTAFNESGTLIDSTFRLGRPGETRLGIGGLIPGESLPATLCRCTNMAVHEGTELPGLTQPADALPPTGFEQGIKSMRVGGKRRIVVPPELGPPVGPSTFFSAKQCEVFDVELQAVRICTRRQVMMFSDVVCE